ncbi:MAG: CAP domain-containing protein [Acaryochloris sp. RU_4_1]|nr:CAP domain-containing protein [Acaryochloris sp. RU_4_1]NJR55278.1 CAP domain-containing protein [Acaryochloris sp. CRU_2_0]
MHLLQRQQASSFFMIQRWTKLFSGIMVVGLSLLTSPSYAKPSASVATYSTSPSSIELATQSNTLAQMEAQVWQQINQQRQRHGLPALQLNRQLSLVARSHSQQMAHHNFYSHVDQQGRNHRRRVEASGLRAYLIGENLMRCKRINDPASVSVSSWMGSPAHRQNILLPEMKETGVGIWKQGNTYYVTQIYIEPK